MVNKKNIKIDELPENMTGSDSENMEILQKQILDLQLEVDILKETIEVIKKDLGANLTALKNREKAVMIDALQDRYSLPTLLRKLRVPKSSYYYQKEALAKENKHEEI